MTTQPFARPVAVLIALACCSGSALAATQPAPAEVAPATTASGTSSASADDLRPILQTIAARAPDVLAAQAARAQADAQVQQTRAAWFGKVDTYATSQHFNDPRLTRPITQPPIIALYPFASDQFGYGLDFQLPIDVSGQIAAEVDAAKSRARGAQWSAEDVRLRVLLQGASLYRSLQALAGQRSALARQLDALQASRRVAETGLKVGSIARVNLLRVEAAVADVQASLANVEGQEQKLRAQLAALMGVEAFAAPIAPPDAGPAALPANPDAPPPSIQAAQSALQASQAKVQSAQRVQYPQLVANGGWNRNAIQWDSRAIDTWQVNLGVRLNLWAGGGQKSALDAAQAAEEEARQRLRGAHDNLRAAREGAVAQWHAQDQARRAAESGLLAAAESAHIEHNRFANGLGSATELIDAEAALARARASLAGAIASWWQADDALRYAYGEPPAALQEPNPNPAPSQQP